MARASLPQSCALARQSRTLLSPSLPVMESTGADNPSGDAGVLLSRKAIVVTIENILMPGLSGVPKQNTRGPWQRETRGPGKLW